MSQHQPGWANQPQQPQSQWNAQQTQPMWGAPPPPAPKKRSAGKIVGLGCLGVVGLFVVLGIAAAATSGGSKSDSSGGTASTSHSPSKGAALAKTPGPAQMLADLDGDKRSPGDYQTALNALAPKCKQTPKQLAATANAMVEDLQKNGVNDETDYSALIHLNQSIPAGAPKMDCQDIAAAYLVEREGGTS